MYHDAHMPAELTALHTKGNTMDSQIKSRKTSNSLVKFKRLMPGGVIGIGAMADNSGDITDDTKRIGNLLCEHWARVFGNKIQKQRYLG